MSSDAAAARIVEEATKLVRAGEPFQAVVGRVVELGAEMVPSPVWGAIGGVDSAADVDRATAWLLRQIESRPPPDDLAALWFALYEVRGSAPGRTEAFMAVSGTTRPPGPEWLSTKSWDPHGYAPAPGLRSLLPLAASGEPEVGELVRSAVVPAYGVGLTAAVLDAVDPGVVLAGRHHLVVATGPSEGEPVVVGDLTPAGLDRSGVARP